MKKEPSGAKEVAENEESVINSKTVNLVIENNNDKANEFSVSIMSVLREMKRFFWLWFIPAVLIGVLILSAVIFTTKEDNKVRTLVEFSFSGIESGLDPKGNVFDPNDLKAPTVIENAFNEIGIDAEFDDKFNINTIRGRITLTGVIPERIQKLEELAKETKKAPEAFHPSQYYVEFDYSGFELTKEQSAMFLDAVVKNYREYFFRKYGYNVTLGNAVAAIDYKKYDYERALNLFADSVAMAESYVSQLSTNDKTNFRSVQTGYSFADLAAALRTVRVNNMDRLRSYMDTYNITKDRDFLISYYTFRIDECNRSKSASTITLASVEKSIEDYKMGSIYLPGKEGAEGMMISQTSDAYDALINQKISIQSEIASYDSQISYYEKRVTKLKEQTGTEITANEAVIEVVEAEMDILNEELTDLLEKIRITGEEYFESAAFGNSCTALSASKFSGSGRLSKGVKSAIIPCAAVEAVLLVVFIAIAFSKAVKKEYLLNKKS